MAKIVTTARGEALNFDALITKSQRPANHVDPASKITPAPRPDELPRALNLRGFMPAQSTTELPQNPHPQAAPVPAPEQTVSENLSPASDKSIADFTKITVDQAGSIRSKDGATPAPGDGAKLAEKILAAKETGQKRIHGKGAGKSTLLDDLDDKAEGIET